MISIHHLSKPTRSGHYPKDRKVDLRKGELLTVEDHETFGPKEANVNPSDGIGVYRSGIQKQLPSYYI